MCGQEYMYLLEPDKIQSSNKVPLKRKLPPFVLFLLRRESHLETQDSRLSRRESSLARTSKAYILE